MKEKTDSQKNKPDFFIIADHLRTIIFALTDGAIFGQKDRGYILKKMIKKVCLLTYLLKSNDQNLEKIINVIIDTVSLDYPKLNTYRLKTTTQLKEEIKKQFNFLKKANLKLNLLSNKVINAAELFFLYDTQGIPQELIKKHLEQKKIKFPKEEFKKLLKKQKQQSKTEREKKNINIF